ncbi:unnamed protein product [Pieris brassicae]|uniref:FAD-dependent oxidoreductase domain-containing protein 1 n=2 Tax=Pieris brassicae TaxID=7116 RepID=A0A9P0T5X6_PIEBR|nr:unnamed protein product [Pieris brassicae]
MLSSKVLNKLLLLESFNTLTKRTYVEFKHPIQRTINAINNDINSKLLKKEAKPFNPEHADVVIIGGGYLGSSGAYWLKSRAGEGLNVVVLEKNFKQNTLKSWPTTVLSQHYSLPENILLSQYSTDFLRNIKQKTNKDVNIKFYPHGCLVLASDKYADILEKNVTTLKEFGIRNELLSVDQLSKKYPWINTSDVKLGCISTENEGVFDSFALHQALVKKSQELGANYIHGEVVGFDLESQRDVLMEGVKPMSYQKIERVIYKTEDGEEHSIKFAVCVLAAGTDSSNIARLANIGSGSGLLSLSLPVGKRESNIYSVECSTGQSNIALNSPIVMDTSGLWIRKNGLHNNILCSQIPLKSDNVMTPEENFERLLKPSLDNRFPNLTNAKIQHWHGAVYDCNNFDDSGILGAHPYHTNLIFATGFGQLGVQHAPGIGKAISDLVIDCHYTDTDLTRFGFDRLLINEPLIDFNVY